MVSLFLGVIPQQSFDQTDIRGVYFIQLYFAGLSGRFGYSNAATSPIIQVRSGNNRALMVLRFGGFFCVNLYQLHLN